jgi:hypothetical protein
VEGGKDRWKIERKTKKFYRRSKIYVCVPIMHEARKQARNMSSNLLFWTHHRDLETYHHLSFSLIDFVFRPEFSIKFLAFASILLPTLLYTVHF